MLFRSDGKQTLLIAVTWNLLKALVLLFKYIYLARVNYRSVSRFLTKDRTRKTYSKKCDSVYGRNFVADQSVTRVLKKCIIYMPCSSSSKWVLTKPLQTFKALYWSHCAMCHDFKLSKLCIAPQTFSIMTSCKTRKLDRKFW